MIAATGEACRNCGGARRRRRVLPTGEPIYACAVCGLQWWDWPAFQPAAFYDRNYFEGAADAKGYNAYSALEPGIRKTARARLKRLERMLGGGGRMFEIGCGTGVFLDEARAAGWEVGGVEVSAYAADVARRRGLAVDTAAAEDVNLAPAAYDAIVMWDVIEHLRDPFELVTRLRAALRCGGVLALSTGDASAWTARLSGARWHLYNLPEHLYFFTRAALRHLLHSRGFTVRREVYESVWVPTHYLWERLNKTLLGRRLPAPAPAAAGWVVPANLFDVIGVYAERVT